MKAAQAPAFDHVVIRASAGSGKTFQLTNRYLALLHRGVAPESILAVTFTRKAAGEILDRILLRLAHAASSDEQCRLLAEHIAAPDLTREACRALLVKVTQALHRLRVGTLDSFFNKIAGSCSMELGLPLAWRIIEELADARLRDRAIAESLAGDSMQPVLTLLNLLTKGEASRSVSRLIRDTVKELYTIARETDAAVWKKLPRCKGLTAEELSAACERLQALSFPDKRFTECLRKDCDYITGGNWPEFVKKGIASCLLGGSATYYSKPIDEDVRAVYEPLLTHAKSVLVNTIAAQTEATHDLLSRFHEHYQRLKHSQAALRFEDITFVLARSAASDHDRVVFRLDAAIDHLLLDEFQDTSLAQWQVLRPIARRVASSKKSTSFFCVGDAKQAIYGWRGGLAELFDAVKQELPGLCEKPLDISYRSSQPVIDVVNRVFTRLDQHPNLGKYENAVRRWQTRFTPHETTKGDLAGYVSLETCPRCDDDDDEAAADEQFNKFVAERIAAAYRSRPGMSIGVLTRTNDAVAQIIFRLRALGIPASEEGGNPLTDSCAVELVLSLVRLADHPGDRAAAYHIARSPLGEHFELAEDTYRRTALLSERLRRELLEQGYGRTIYRWAQLLARSCDARDRSRLQQLVELAYAWQPESTLRPGDFLRYVEEKRVSDPTTSAVRVMTVHQAKGLEFDIVILPELDSNRTLLGQTPWLVSSRTGVGGDIDCVCRYVNEDVQKLLPKSFQKMFEAAIDEQISEALCVLYVALTRAVHALHMLVRPPKDGKQLPKTFAGLLRGALCDETAASGAVLFEHGKPNWYELEKKRRKAGMRKVETVVSTPPARIALAPPPVEQRRGLQRESPSKLEGGAKGRMRRALQLSDPKRDMAMLRGTVIHCWFEQVCWLDDGSPIDDELLAALASLRGIELATEKMRRIWLTDFRAMLSQRDVPIALKRASYRTTLPKSWLKVLKGDTTLDVHNEYPFAVIDGPQLLQGRMDRVVFLSRGSEPVAADVLDFKTDAISDSPGERLQDRVEHYRPQVEAYCRMLAMQTGLQSSQVSAALLFVGPGILVRPAGQR